ncbi:hypothetical protein ABC347_18095 [Sphingomonas sp. 1P06PA]
MAICSGRYADRRGIHWVPATLMDEYQALLSTPLPGSADLERA